MRFFDLGGDRAAVRIACRAEAETLDQQAAGDRIDQRDTAWPGGAAIDSAAIRGDGKLYMDRGFLAERKDAARQVPVTEASADLARPDDRFVVPVPSVPPAAPAIAQSASSLAGSAFD
jgi:hypothetical protein